MNRNALPSMSRIARQGMSNRAALSLRGNVLMLMASKSAGMNLGRSASRFLNKIANRFPGRTVEASLFPTLITLQSRFATRSPDKNVSRFPGKSATLSLARNATLNTGKTAELSTGARPNIPLNRNATRFQGRIPSTELSKNVALSMRETAGRLPESSVIMFRDIFTNFK